MYEYTLLFIPGGTGMTALWPQQRAPGARPPLAGHHPRPCHYPHPCHCICHRGRHCDCHPPYHRDGGGPHPRICAAAAAEAATRQPGEWRAQSGFSLETVPASTQGTPGNQYSGEVILVSHWRPCLHQQKEPRVYRYSGELIQDSHCRPCLADLAPHRGTLLTWHPDARKEEKSWRPSRTVQAARMAATSRAQGTCHTRLRSKSEGGSGDACRR